jgi:hypothetical protein
VRARAFFTARDDGLARPWRGNVWLNPPYAAGVVDRFIEKLCQEVGETVPQAVLLVNNATDTAWFQLAARHAATICFPSGRVRFLNENNEPVGAPLQGQAVLYFGERLDAFRAAFSAFGFCASLHSREV